MFMPVFASTTLILFGYWLTRPHELIISNRARGREALRIVGLIVIWGILLNSFLPNIT